MSEITITPRAGMTLLQHAQLNWKPTCESCRGDAHGNTCENCGDALCDECEVACRGCDNLSTWCVRCAISRQAFEQRDGAWYCENCPAEVEAHLVRKPAARELTECQEAA